MAVEGTPGWRCTACRAAAFMRAHRSLTSEGAGGRRIGRLGTRAFLDAVRKRAQLGTTVGEAMRNSNARCPSAAGNHNV